MNSERIGRRTFLGAAGAAAATPLAAQSLLGRHALGDEPANADNSAQTADSCIFIWLGGGACHVDTWDPKRVSTGKKDPGSAYPAIPTAIQGVQVCEHLSRMADRLDRCVLMRTVNHDVIDEHAAATNRLHTGRPPTGTTVYPSIGSVCAHQMGAQGSAPAYVVMGYPSASRGPGFLGAKYGYVYLTDTKAGPAGLRRPHGVDPERQARRTELLAELRKRYRQRYAQERAIQDYIETSREAFRIAGPDFMKVFQLNSEPDSLREAYGDEFGQRCLLARRLVESGVRFVEVAFNLNFINGTGWDTHNQGQQNQHVLIQQLDQSLAALVDDLEKRGRLDKTLIVVATEFGRPPEFDAGGGRGHYSKAFSVVLAGGGLKTGQAIGTTDELGKKILDRPVSIPDLHATIYRALGVEHDLELYDGDRPVPITDQGKPVGEVFA